MISASEVIYTDCWHGANGVYTGVKLFPAPPAVTSCCSRSAMMGVQTPWKCMNSIKLSFFLLGEQHTTVGEENKFYPTLLSSSEWTNNQIKTRQMNRRKLPNLLRMYGVS